MEEKYKQVTDIIEGLAAANPYITKEQIAKAKSMYNGDTRPIEIIRAELEAYSESIMEQGKKTEADREKFANKPEKQEPIPERTFPQLRGTVYHPEENVMGESVGQEPTPDVEPTPEMAPTPEQQPISIVPSASPEVLDSLRVSLPGEDKQRELQSMIDDALGSSSDGYSDENEYQSSPVYSQEQAKVLVKTQEQAQNSGESNSSVGNDGGYGNVPALLSLTIIFSIVTIIMAFFTIIAR